MVGVKLVGEKEEMFSLMRDESDVNLVHFKYSTMDHCDVPTQFILDKHESGGTLDREIFTKRLCSHLRDATTLLGRMEIG